MFDFEKKLKRIHIDDINHLLLMQKINIILFTSTE